MAVSYASAKPYFYGTGRRKNYNGKGERNHEKDDEDRRHDVWTL